VKEGGRTRIAALAIATGLLLSACDADAQDQVPDSAFTAYSSDQVVPTPLPTRERPLTMNETIDWVRKATSISLKFVFGAGYEDIYPGVLIDTKNGAGVLFGKDFPSKRGTGKLINGSTGASEDLDRQKFEQEEYGAIYYPGQKFLDSLKAKPLQFASDYPKPDQDVLVTGLYGLQEAKVKSVSTAGALRGFSIESLAQANFSTEGAIVILFVDRKPVVGGMLSGSMPSVTKRNGEEVFLQTVIPIISS